jgi:hypothetical protein
MKKIIVALTVILFVIGFIIGIYNKITFPNETLFENSSFFFFLNLLIIVLAYGFTIMCIPAFLLVYMYESLMMGFCTSFFLINFGFKSVLFILILLIYKIIVLFFLILNSFYYYKYVIHLFNYIFKKIYISKHNIKLYIKKITIITFFLLVLLISYYLLTLKVFLPTLNKLL